MTSNRSTTSSAAPTRERGTGSDRDGYSARDGYKVPLVGVPVPARLVESGFWGGLLGAAVLGALDPPLALLLGAGVVVARHRRS